MIAAEAVDERDSVRPTRPPLDSYHELQVALRAEADVAERFLEQVPVRVINGEDLEWFELSADAQRALGYVDGSSTVASIAAACGCAPGVLRELEAQGLVTWQQPCVQL